jgi:hypothetical protein
MKQYLLYTVIGCALARSIGYAERSEQRPPSKSPLADGGHWRSSAQNHHPGFSHSAILAHGAVTGNPTVNQQNLSVHPPAAMSQKQTANTKTFQGSSAPAVGLPNSKKGQGIIAGGSANSTSKAAVINGTGMSRKR